MRHEVRKIEFPKDASFCKHPREIWDFNKFPSIWAIGDPELLKADLTALFCSARCPGNVILKSYEFAVKLRDHGTAVIGGFQTPVEKECFNILLKGSQPIIVCPARNIQNMRIPDSWKKAIHDGRLLIASPFDERYKRATTISAELRNRFLVAAADKIFFLHAAPKSKTFTFAEELIRAGKNVFTFDMMENENLMSADASIRLRAESSDLQRFT